jgi:hypothetical protein
MISSEGWILIAMQLATMLVSIGMILQWQKETGRRLALVETNKADHAVMMLHVARLDTVDSRLDRDITSVRHDLRNVLQRKEMEG